MMLASGGSVNDANSSHQEVDDNIMDVDVEMMEMEAGGGGYLLLSLLMI